MTSIPTEYPDVKRIIEDHFGAGSWDKLRWTELKSDASGRSYFRVNLEAPHQGQSAVLMCLPEEPDSARDVSDENTELPFINVQRLLSERGLRVPMVHSCHRSGRFFLLEDLGNETFENRVLRAAATERLADYTQAIKLLAHMQRKCATADNTYLPFQRHYDRELIRWELDHFLEWGLEVLYGPMKGDDRRELNTEFDRMADLISNMPKAFVHRDYQSRNLMWIEKNGVEQLVVIDFQDALTGPRMYDVVALLCDSYVPLEEHEQMRLLEIYFEEVRAAADERKVLVNEFWTLAIQRKLKDAGRFVYIDRVRKNRDFLKWYPQSFVYIARALGYLNTYNALDALLDAYLPGYPAAVAVPRATSG